MSSSQICYHYLKNRKYQTVDYNEEIERIHCKRDKINGRNNKIFALLKSLLSMRRMNSFQNNHSNDYFIIVIQN